MEAADLQPTDQKCRQQPGICDWHLKLVEGDSLADGALDLCDWMLAPGRNCQR